MPYPASRRKSPDRPHWHRSPTSPFVSPSALSNSSSNNERSFYRSPINSPNTPPDRNGRGRSRSRIRNDIERRESVYRSERRDSSYRSDRREGSMFRGARRYDDSHRRDWDGGMQYERPGYDRSRGYRSHARAPSYYASRGEPRERSPTRNSSQYRDRYGSVRRSVVGSTRERRSPILESRRRSRSISSRRRCSPSYKKPRLSPHSTRGSSRFPSPHSKRGKGDLREISLSFGSYLRSTIRAEEKQEDRNTKKFASDKHGRSPGWNSNARENGAHVNNERSQRKSLPKERIFENDDGTTPLDRDVSPWSSGDEMNGTEANQSSAKQKTTSKSPKAVTPKEALKDEAPTEKPKENHRKSKSPKDKVEKSSSSHRDVRHPSSSHLKERDKATSTARTASHHSSSALNKDRAKRAAAQKKSNSPVNNHASCEIKEKVEIPSLCDALIKKWAKEAPPAQIAPRIDELRREMKNLKLSVPEDRHNLEKLVPGISQRTILLPRVQKETDRALHRFLGPIELRIRSLNIKKFSLGTKLLMLQKKVELEKNLVLTLEKGNNSAVQNQSRESDEKSVNIPNDAKECIKEPVDLTSSAEARPSLPTSFPFTNSLIDSQQAFLISSLTSSSNNTRRSSHQAVT